MKEQFDDKSAYCRSLGHYVPFKYCRTVNYELPCIQIENCWHEKLEITKFIKEEYTDSERELIFSPHPDKISTILDLITKIKENK